MLAKSDVNVKAEVVRLHSEITTALAHSFDNAIRIGELLTEQKAKLEHGQFLPWVKENLPFSDRTARNYMTLHSRRDELKLANVSDLSAAYQMLSSPMVAGKPQNESENRLSVCEAKIASAASDWIGAAKTIRDCKLWAEGYPSWDAFCIAKIQLPTAILDELINDFEQGGANFFNIAMMCSEAQQ